MPVAMIDGIETYYEVYGAGPAVLMLAPGGFDATVDKWRVASAWKELDAVAALSQRHRLILYDRRESGQSGGRVERLGWSSYARHAKSLLEHLNIDCVTVLGGCMGCSVALAFAVRYPEATRALVLHWPVGGYRWKMTGRDRFERHYGFTKERGLSGVIERARQHKSFWNDPEAGPWASVIARDASFAQRFAGQNLDRYLGVIVTSGRSLFDRDTATGAEPEEILGIHCHSLVIPGDDVSHATSAAHYLRECLPTAEFWNVMPPEQTTRTVCERILQFCGTYS
jgi:pimeloyl-ACP methyl ester carboxylesterase